MTFGSSWVMGGWVSTARVFLRGELAHLSPQALDVVDRSYRVALGVRSVEAGLLRYRECSTERPPRGGVQDERPRLGRADGEHRAPCRGSVASRARGWPALRRSSRRSGTRRVCGSSPASARKAHSPSCI